jgi:hypothetical protein
LDEKNDEIASLILAFLAKHSVSPIGTLFHAPRCNVAPAVTTNRISP